MNLDRKCTGEVIAVGSHFYRVTPFTELPHMTLCGPCQQTIHACIHALALAICMYVYMNVYNRCVYVQPLYVQLLCVCTTVVYVQLLCVHTTAVCMCVCTTAVCTYNRCVYVQPLRVRTTAVSNFKLYLSPTEYLFCAKDGLNNNAC